MATTKKTKSVVTSENRGSIFKFLEEADCVDFIKGMLSLKASKDLWGGILAVPPGTLIDEIVGEFERKTDIPLEIPFFVFFHMVAGLLLHSGKRAIFEESIAGGNIKTDIWSLILAPSGSGKSYTHKVLRNIAKKEMEEIEFEADGIVSSAKFIEELADDNNNKLFLRDEFGEFYKSIQDDKGPLKDMKDYLLRIYDNGQISRKTKGNEIVVPEAALVVLGLAVDSSFIPLISPDDLINGFAQRFSYILSKKDKRKITDFPIYKPDVATWSDQWDKLVSSIVHDEYIITDNAIEGYIVAFRSLVQKDVPDSFYRRLLWKAHKYAFIYHIIRGCGEDKKISVEDYGWAARMLFMHLQDTLSMLTKYNTSDLSKLIEQCKVFIDKNEAKGVVVTPRILVQGIKNIKTVSEAKGILSIIK